MNTLNLQTPQASDQRPWDLCHAAGPPAEPISFPEPVIQKGRSMEVLCYIPDSDSHERLPNVLIRESSRRPVHDKDLLAYFPIPYKAPIATIMGHVRICSVLKWSMRNKRYELTKEYVVVKVNYKERMRRLRDRHAEDPMKEIAAMQVIGDSSAHVPGCRDVIDDVAGQTLNIVLRYCRDGDLFDMLKDFQGRNFDTLGLTEPQARYWFKQILLGVKHLRDLGICHRDLSPENIMMDENQCLVIDFGMCLQVPYTDPENTNGTTDITKGTHKRLVAPQGACGKMPYMSPEIFKEKPFDGESVDVWTAGIILFVMLTGNKSYGLPHTSDPKFYWMTHGLERMLQEFGVALSPEGLNLLQNMIQITPSLRLTLDECLAHPWFDGPTEEMDSML